MTMTPKPPRPIPLPGQTWTMSTLGYAKSFGIATLRIESIDGPIANCVQIATGRACKVSVSTLRRGLRGAKLVEPEGVTT